MTKAENRAAARAYQQEQERKRREERHAAAVAADLEQLRTLRDYLIFKRQVLHIPRNALTRAIDDYVEQLTGDRTKLHAQGHTAGGTVTRGPTATDAETNLHRRP